MNKLKFLYRKYREGPNFPLRNSKNGTFVFIHINKTAGTSISRALGLPKKRHLTVKNVIDIIGIENYRKAFSFAVVRNPWAKVVSHYNYRLRTNETLQGEKKIPFTEWVNKTYGADKNAAYLDAPKMFMPQVEWLKDYSNSLSVDRIVRFENLCKDMNEVFREIGFDNVTLPVMNQTKRVYYREYYDKITEGIIRSHFAEDVRLFNYEF